MQNNEQNLPGSVTGDASAIAGQIAESEINIARQAARKAMDSLNQSNRILKESAMLSRTTKLSDEQIATVKQRYTEYTVSRGVTAAQVGKECGYSRSALSEWASGKYSGNIDAVTHAVNDWLERDAARRDSRRPKNEVATWIAEDIRSQSHLASKLSMMAALVVPSGAGKTMVLKALTEEMRGIYIYVNEGQKARDLYFAIASALGWQNQTSTRSRLQRYIVEKLTGTHRIIFIDEAHHAGKHIGSLRSIHDQAGVPIVFAGTDEILTAIDDRAHGRGQFSSRTIRYCAMDFVSSEHGGGGGKHGRDLFTIDEIKAFFAMKKIRLDRDALMTIWAIACLPGEGTLRLVENLIDTAFSLDPEISTFTRDHVAVALQSLKGGMAGPLLNLAGRRADAFDPAPLSAMAG